MPEGTIYYQEAGGGGGYADPFERDPQLVLKDAKNEKISLESARKYYGVVIDQKTWTVDENETTALRAKRK